MKVALLCLVLFLLAVSASSQDCYFTDCFYVGFFSEKYRPSRCSDGFQLVARVTCHEYSFWYIRQNCCSGRSH
ncbi:hypothetical protein QR680_018058 [Steinernema hermaphroditum]|uniref:Uncharacterized protein n=1 Tax=Steinernema hermaphroditum TaxID=289476 RepID=A0AA39LQH7_9BILA|nr:hypothetical protein QR680_018058 [Steinernema hermaphroditum]